MRRVKHKGNHHSGYMSDFMCIIEWSATVKTNARNSPTIIKNPSMKEEINGAPDAAWDSRPLTDYFALAADSD